MNNSGVTCDVCQCVHNCGCNKCELPEITITEQSTTSAQSVETPHYCKDYRAK